MDETTKTWNEMWTVIAGRAETGTAAVMLTGSPSEQFRLVANVVALNPEWVEVVFYTQRKDFTSIRLAAADLVRFLAPTNLKVEMTLDLKCRVLITGPTALEECDGYFGVSAKELTS